MKCDVCRERAAIIFVQQVSRDSSIELHLCETCARERGFSTENAKIDVSLGGLFSGIMEGKNDTTGKHVQCQVCGISLSDIKKHRKTGCADCYLQFRGEIVSLLRNEGVEISYSGEYPAKLNEVKKTKMNPENLKKELQRAIEQEDYEMAAYYRDRIRALGGSK